MVELTKRTGKTIVGEVRVIPEKALRPKNGRQLTLPHRPLCEKLGIVH